MNTLTARQDLAVLTEVAAALAEAGLDLPVLLDTITDLLATHVSDGAVVYLLQDDGVTLGLESMASDDPGRLETTWSALGNRPRRLDDGGHISKCVATRRPVLVNNISIDALRPLLPEEYRRLLHLHSVPHSFLFVPLLANGEPFGVLVASRSPNPDGFNPDDVDLICDVAELATPAILNARLHEQLAEMTALFESVFARAPIGMAIHTVEEATSSFMRVNDALAEILGRSEADLVGTPVADVVAFSSRAEVDGALDRVAAGTLAGHGDDIELTRADGTTITAWIDWRVVHIEPGSLLILSQVQPLPEPRP